MSGGPGAGSCIWYPGSASRAPPPASSSDGDLARLMQAMATHTADAAAPDPLTASQAAKTLEQQIAAGRH